MTKYEFLAELQKDLASLPTAEARERLNFYSEMIDDLVDDGMTEEEAVAKISGDRINGEDTVEVTPINEAPDTVTDIPTPVVEAPSPVNTPTPKSEKKKRGSMTPLAITLLVLGSPLWVSLLIGLVSVVFSVYVSIWSAVISLWAVPTVLGVAALIVLVQCIVFLITTGPLAAISLLGAAFVCAGIAILMFIICKYITKGAFYITKKPILWVISLFN